MSILSWILSAVLFLNPLFPTGGLSFLALPMMAGAMGSADWSSAMGGGGGSAPDIGEQDGLDYIVTNTYDPATQIQRTTLDTGDLDLSVYLEIPVFRRTDQGYQAIDAFFRDLRASFFSYDNETLETVFQAVSDPAYPPDGYFYQLDALIPTQDSHLVSVTIIYSWYMGGVFDYGSDSYTFRTDTGELLALSDLIDASDEEIVAAILTALREQDGGSGDLDLEGAAARDVDSFDFYVQDGKIWLAFDKYEMSYGAYGSFDLELDLPLSLPS